MPGCEIGGLARLGFGVPALQFDEHWPQQDAIGHASHESSFGNRADKHRRAAPLRRPGGAAGCGQLWARCRWSHRQSGLAPPATSMATQAHTTHGHVVGSAQRNGAAASISANALRLITCLTDLVTGRQHFSCENSRVQRQR